MSESSYKGRLESWAKDGRVIVQRANMPDLEGAARFIERDGVVICFDDDEGKMGDTVQIYVAYSDICGVGRRIKGDGN